MHGTAFKLLFRPYFFSNDPATFDSIKAKGLERVKDSFNFIEERLDGIHAVGGAFTVVDLYFFVFYRWGNEVGLDMKEMYPRYTALIVNLVKRPAVKDTLEAEGIDSSL